MPVFSVIVPIYNGEQFIHRCVDSMLSQTFGDLELILIDDGSSDSCAEICDEYAAKDDRVIVIHAKNKGVSKARNEGLAIASGEYLAFCDGDDYYKNDLLEKTYQTAVKYNADVVSYKLERISENEAQKPRDENKIDIFDLNADSRFRFIYDVVTWKTKGWQACRSIFRREIVEKNRIKFCDTCNNFAEDLGFTLEYLLYTSRIVFLNEYLYCYYDVREDSMMNKSQRVYKVNDVNELSYYLRPIITAQMPDSPFCVIHHYIVFGQLMDMYKVKKFSGYSTWIKLIKSLDKKDYFKQQNTDYYKFYKKQKGIHGKNRIIKFYLSRVGMVNRYLGSLNRAGLLFDCAAKKVLSKVFRWRYD